MVSFVARFCFCDGLTDTMRENNEHLFSPGLVGQQNRFALFLLWWVNAQMWLETNLTTNYLSSVSFARSAHLRKLTSVLSYSLPLLLLVWEFSHAYYTEKSASFFNSHFGRSQVAYVYVKKFSIILTYPTIPLCCNANCSRKRKRKILFLVLKFCLEIRAILHFIIVKF